MPRWPIADMGSGSWIDVAGGQVDVRSILGFRCRFDASNVSGAEVLDDDVGSVGIHGGRGRWLINGAPRPILVITLKEPVRARLFGLIRVKVRQVMVSVRSPDRVIDSLLGASSNGP